MSEEVATTAANTDDTCERCEELRATLSSIHDTAKATEKEIDRHIKSLDEIVTQLAEIERALESAKLDSILDDLKSLKGDLEERSTELYELAQEAAQ